MKNNILIKNCIVLPMTSTTEEKYYRGHIGIENDTIALVTRQESAAVAFAERFSGNIEVIDASGMLAMPGLVNTHNHIAMTLMRSYADDLPLMPWLHDHIWPFEARLEREDILMGARLGMAEMLLGGTTSSADMYWMQDAAGQAAEELGMRIVLSPTFTDSKFAEFEADLARCAEKYGPGRHPHVSLMIAPHSAYTCSPENLKKAKEIADRLGVAIQIHISETLDEQNMILEQYGKSPVKHLDQLGLLTDTTLAVHCVHVDEQDIEIMARRGVSIAHNPQSNMKLSSGTAPVQRFVEAGINVSIGTDGSSSNNDLDMWDELRSASFLQKSFTWDPCVLPAYEVLKMATVNGARALGLDRVGKLAEGMLADVILLDIEKPHLFPRHDMIGNLVYCAKSSDVDTVIVGGRMVVQNCRLLSARAKELGHDVERQIEDIKKR